MLAVHVFVYIHTTYPPLFSLFSLLKMTLTGFSVQYLYMCRKRIDQIYPPLPSSFTPNPVYPSLYHDLIYISDLQ
jgi:hypothetical protein